MKRVRLPVNSQSARAGAPSCRGRLPAEVRAVPYRRGRLARRVTRAGVHRGRGRDDGGCSRQTAIARSGAPRSKRPASDARRYAPPIPVVAMAIDLKCIGCRKCAYACRIEQPRRDPASCGSITDAPGQLAPRTRRPSTWRRPTRSSAPAVGCQRENPPCVQACPPRGAIPPASSSSTTTSASAAATADQLPLRRGTSTGNGPSSAAERNRRPGAAGRCGREVQFCIHRTRLGKPQVRRGVPVGARVR